MKLSRTGAWVTLIMGETAYTALLDMLIKIHLFSNDDACILWFLSFFVVGSIGADILAKEK